MSLKVLLIALAAVAAFACSNGVQMTAFYKKLNLNAPARLETPEILAAAEFCPSLEGKKSCCNAATLTEMQAAHTEYTTQVQATFMSLIEKHIAGCDKLDALDQTSKLGYKFERLRADTIVALSKLADKCQEAAIEYTRSTLCMTCDAELADYTENGKVFVDESDLVSVHESCSSFFTESKKFEATLQSHETRLRAVGCKQHTLAVLDSKTINLCISAQGTQESLRKYVVAVGQALYNKFDISEKHEIRFNKGVVSVCDENGCESQKLPATAAKLFGDEFNTNFVQHATGSVVASNVRRLAIRKTSPTAWEGAISAGFFEVEAFTTGKKSSAVIELVEEGGYRPIQILQATTTTNTTVKPNGTVVTTTNTTANASATTGGSPGLAGSIKDKLNNASASIDAYYQTTGNSGVLVQVMFAVLTIATTALLI